MLLRPITRPIRSYGHRLSSWESRQSFGETRKRLMTAHVQVFERRCARTLHARRRPASEKRQGTKSRREMFGGARPWFMCPVQSNGVYCGRRVTKLSGVGRWFACRHCYRLAYTSQQESARDRGLWKSQKIRIRLGGSAGMLDDFPDKPKGMHRQTYDRLCRVHDAAEERSIIGLMHFVERLGRRSSRRARS